MIRLRLVATLATALLLSACAVPMRTTLTPEQRGKITELSAHVVVVQDEVIAAVEASNVSGVIGGGLIGVIIDSKVTNSRVNESQQALGPFYAAIEDVDYRQEFNASIEKGLAGYPIKVGKVTTTPRAISQGKLDQLRGQLKTGQALLVIFPRYTLSGDFRAFDSESVVTIWFRPEVSDSRMPSHRGVLHYQSALVGPGGKASLDKWAANDAALFRQVMQESISETIRMVMIDVDTPVPANFDKSLQSFSMNVGAATTQIKGKALKSGNGRTIVLGEDQRLHSLPAASAGASTTTASAQK